MFNILANKLPSYQDYVTKVRAMTPNLKSMAKVCLHWVQRLVLKIGISHSYAKTRSEKAGYVRSHMTLLPRVVVVTQYHAL